jgi:hypothetical protein
MRFLQPAAAAASTRDLYRRLQVERVIFDLDHPDEIALLRAEVERIARGMDRPEQPPPMLWSGIPWPEGRAAEDCDYCLSISVGGTRTSYLLLRLEKGQVVGLDPQGGEVSGAALAGLKLACRMPTPNRHDTADGLAMIERIAERICRYLLPHCRLLERCRHILLSWGFANRVVRTGPKVLGGISARTTLMTKEQAPFTKDLVGRDLGELFAGAFRRRLDWSRPITVANDGVMALHYFLTPPSRSAHARIGLFINGTGTNFCMAEDYAVRAEGVVSRPGEDYEPERITPHRPLGPGENATAFFVNYETGVIELVRTRTRFDSSDDLSIEANALAGGNAYARQLREIACWRFGEELYRRLLAAWRRLDPLHEQPTGLEISLLAAGTPRQLGDRLSGSRLSSREEDELHLVCRAIAARSALHAALVLAAVTRRNGFGLGSPAGVPDLLAMEGSVWRSPEYPGLVRWYWQKLIEPRSLRVDLAHEQSYDASLPGPLYLAALQD